MTRNRALLHTGVSQAEQDQGYTVSDGGAGQWMGSPLRLSLLALTVFRQPGAAACTLLIPCSELPGLI